MLAPQIIIGRYILSSNEIIFPLVGKKEKVEETMMQVKLLGHQIRKELNRKYFFFLKILNSYLLIQ